MTDISENHSPDPAGRSELKADAALEGGLKLVQPRTGYRFSIDAVLLADFARAEPGDSVVDLGAGCGVIGLALARRLGRGRLISVEIQHRLAECARLNTQNNPTGVETVVLEMDWRDLSPEMISGRVDSVVSNPPYRKLGSGRVNLDQEEALARHEFKGDLASMIEAAKRVLKLKGLLFVVYPADRLGDLFEALFAALFAPKRLRLVHSRITEKAVLALVEASSGGGRELTVLPPLILYGDGTEYTPEAEAILSGKGSDGPGERPSVP